MVTQFGTFQVNDFGVNKKLELLEKGSSGITPQDVISLAYETSALPIIND